MLLIDDVATGAIDDVLDAAEHGARIDVDDAELLLQHARGERLERLLAAASRLRDAGAAASGRAGVITYSRKVFIPLTTLCRDRCHYCVFVDTPAQLRTLRKPVYMTPQQVLGVARQGAALGCKEALLTLGDRPEARWPEARAWLDAHGYASTLDYVGAMARLVTAETGMLAHLNPGVMSEAELIALRPSAPSMGMMLETTSERLYREPGQVHYGSPDKDPAVRLRVIEDAGRARIPFTTGILVGVGETIRDRAESLVAIRAAHERHQVRGLGHVQEVIVQNFRAKERTAMRAAPDAETLEYVAAVAVARLVMGASIRVQVPPNLSDPEGLRLLVEAGADDWGGVSPLTADHVNPERPWPQLDALAERTAELGFTLRERLTAQPEYIQRAPEWIAPGLRPAVARLADPATGLAAGPEPGSAPASTPGPDPASTPGHDLASTPGHARTSARIQSIRRVQHVGAVQSPESGESTESGMPAGAPTGVSPSPFTATVPASAPARTSARIQSIRRVQHVGAVQSPESGDSTESGMPVGTQTHIPALAERAAADPAALDDVEWVALLIATGADLDTVAAVADDVRRYTVGETVSLVVNHDLASGGFRRRPQADPATFTLDDIAGIARDAVQLGATELRVSGRTPPSEDPAASLEIVRAARAAAPQLHLHAYGPHQVWDLAGRGGLGLDGAVAALQHAGVGTLAGTGVKRGRRLVAPDDIDVDRWCEAVAAAHRAGLRSSGILHHGRAETAAERVAHLRMLRRIQSETPGFIDFAPILAGTVPLVAGRSPLDEQRAMVAVSRLLLSGSIPHIRVVWPGADRDALTALLRCGGDDLGGTRLTGRVGPETAAQRDGELPVVDAAALCAHMFRPFRLRTTDYRVR